MVEEKEPVVPGEDVLEEVKEPQPDVEELPPLDPQVHSQFCLPEWEFFRGNCYLMNRNYNSWRAAAAECADLGGTLASVHSPMIYSHFQFMVGRAGFTSAWIGGYHFESSWRWHDGSFFDYFNFASGGAGSSHKCLQMSSNLGQGWSSRSCNTVTPSICQMKVGC
ncbi:unnamed protein product [Knipowitschia caucasica]